ALIPDQIKASVFIRECSVLLDIPERALISELNKIRLGKAKQSDRKPEPPPLPGTIPAEMPAPDAPAAHQVPSSTLMEREIVRILLQYGGEIAPWETESEIPIAPLLVNSLHDATFEDATCSKVIDIYREHINRHEIPETKVFTSHADREIASLAASLLAPKYSLSEKWNDDKRKIHVSREADHLEELVYGAI